MPRIVISVLSIVWMILSGSSLLIIVASLFTTGWLRRLESDSSRWQMECDSIFYNPLSSGSKVKQVSYREVGEDFSDVDNYQPPSIGPFFRCYTPCQDEKSVWSFQWPSTGRTHVFCQIALWGGGQNPANSNAVTWTATILILCGVVALLLATSLLCASLCRRDILGRSTFQLTGVFQCVAGLFLWPAGWDSVPIHEICGASTASYRKGSCEFTEGPIVALFGVCLLFISAALSTLADRSIARHPVNRQMLINGKNFMFV
uniref:Lipoma HMGIC fusion partner-like 2 protein n=1 Tax=Schistocephalus solidus TaxID=70667 RepID=A0A0X3PDT9_SCHSO